MVDVAKAESPTGESRAVAIARAAKQVDQTLSAFSMRLYHEERAHPDWSLTQVLAELTHAR